MYRKSHVYSKKVVFAPLPFLGYKIVLHLVLGAELLCLYACISYKNTILINLLLAKKKDKCTEICIYSLSPNMHSPPLLSTSLTRMEKKNLGLDK